MDDHMYDQMISYAECELIPRFRREYAEKGVVKNCDCYKEMQNLCVALNAVGPYAGYKKVTPTSFIY